MISFNQRLLRSWRTIALLGLTFALISGCNNTFRRIVTPVMTTPSADPQPNKTAIFLSNGGPSVAGYASLVDVSGDTFIGTHQVGANPVFEGLTINGGRTFVVNQASNAVSSFQTAAGVSAALITTSLAAGANPTFMVSNQIGKIWIAAPGTGTVDLIDGSLTVNTQIPVQSNDGCVTPDRMTQQPNGKLYVGCRGSNTVTVISGLDNSILTSGGIALGGSPVWLDVSTSGRFVFVAESSANQIEVIDTVCDQISQKIALSGTPLYLVYNGGSGRVFVVSSGAIDVIDASSAPPTAPPCPSTTAFTKSTVTAHISGATGVTALADGTRFYVSNSGTDGLFSGYVSIYTIAGGLWSKDIQVGRTTASDPVWIASSSDSHKVYTANFGSLDMSIIATANDALVTSLPAPSGQTPTQVVVTP